ncbi:MAG TPA: LacI family transcriptional regulator [Clostridiaceae bacterium]|nr:LacI family transcriptional regulator [Clostridiaceae bacterium]
MCATLKDVAKAANVSTSTVSRVIANNPKISEETKNRVTDIIKRMNYHPNAIARSLANKATRILGIILPNEADDLFKNPFFIQAMTGISIYAQSRGYYIMYAFGKSEKEELSHIKRYISSRLTDGIILLTARHSDKCIQYLKEKEYPFAVIGRPEEPEGVLWVDNDNFQAMYTVVNFLIQKGHTAIGFIGGPQDMTMSRDRLKGYKEALSTNGISIDEKLIVQENNFTEQCGYAAMNEILDYKIPSAVVAIDDLFTFGAMKAVKDRGMDKIPMVGFNNIPLAAYQPIPISSVDINAEELGYNAARLLIEKLENVKMVTNHYIVKTQLIKR